MVADAYCPTLEVRKATLASVLTKAGSGLRHACKLGLEGIVSKREGLALSLWPLA
jgi:hypothetical protein